MCTCCTRHRVPGHVKETVSDRAWKTAVKHYIPIGSLCKRAVHRWNISFLDLDYDVKYLEVISRSENRKRAIKVYRCNKVSSAFEKIRVGFTFKSDLKLLFGTNLSYHICFPGFFENPAKLCHVIS